MYKVLRNLVGSWGQTPFSPRSHHLSLQYCTLDLSCLLILEYTFSLFVKTRKFFRLLGPLSFYMTMWSTTLPISYNIANFLSQFCPSIIGLHSLDLKSELKITVCSLIISLPSQGSNFLLLVRVLLSRVCKFCFSMSLCLPVTCSTMH